MDQQVSEDIRSRLEHCALEELLPDDKIEERQRGLPRPSQRSYNNLAEIAASNSEDSGSEPPPQGGNSLPKDRNSRTSKLGSLWSIKSKDLGILKSVVEALKQGCDSLLRIQSPVNHYEYTCNVETRRELNRVLWRFLTTLYCDLISELDATKQRCSTTEKNGVATVVAVICKSGTHDSDTVRKKVMGWVRVGRRYRGFMQALCSGCIILFPEKPSDLVWEQYVPIKGDMFTKVIQFLQDLGIVGKCEEEGWNGLSDKILQTLRVHFRRLIPFRFQPDRQSQIGWGANSSPAPVTSDTDIHKPPSSRTLDPKALPRLPANGLIKIKWPGAVCMPYFGGRIGDMLFDFYVNSICVGRTVLKKDNAYLNEFLPVLYSNGRTTNPVLALAASYFKEYFAEGSAERKQMEYAECQYIVATAAEVREAIMRGDVGPSTAVAAALLLHEATLNPSLHPCCWTKYLYPMLDPAGADVEANLAMASTAILARTFLPLNGKRTFQLFDYSWIVSGEIEQLTKVNSNLGLSRLMLYFIYSVMQEAKKHPSEQNAERLLRQIDESPQWVDQTEGEMPRLVALKTAETYRLATRLFCLSMLCDYTPDHPAVKQTCALLLIELYGLRMEWFSSIYPAWCAVIACVCVQEVEDWTKVVNVLDIVAGADKSNVIDLCALVRMVRVWQGKEWESREMQGKEPRWWQRMAGHIDGKVKTVICLA